jgi:hypothetical protein
VVPLTVTPGNSEELLGGAGSQPMHSDATANRVLVKGEPVPAPPGRADDFVWPLGSDGKSVAPAAAAPAANAVVRTEPPAAAAKPSEEPKRGAAAKTSQTTGAKPRFEHPVETKPRPPQSDMPRPPRGIPQSGGPFGWQR